MKWHVCMHVCVSCHSLACRAPAIAQAAMQHQRLCMVLVQTWSKWVCHSNPVCNHVRCRYGHTVTRAGRDGELLIIYGGMQSGGYQGEIESLAVLRATPCKPQPKAQPSKSMAASSAPSTAAAAGSQDAPARTKEVPAMQPSSIATSRPRRVSGTSSGGSLRGAQHMQVSISKRANQSGPQDLDSEDNEESAIQYSYAWEHPKLTGCDPVARGYHSAAANEDGTKFYIFGGMSEHDSIADLVCKYTHGPLSYNITHCIMHLWAVRTICIVLSQGESDYILVRC